MCHFIFQMPESKSTKKLDLCVWGSKAILEKIQSSLPLKQICHTKSSGFLFPQSGQKAIPFFFETKNCIFPYFYIRIFLVLFFKQIL